MKHFLGGIVCVGLIVIAIFTLIVGVKVYATRNVDFRFPEEKHIFFMGASHPLRGIDDTITKTAVNYSASSERYMFTYLKLKELLAVNSQIDTIFLQVAPTDLWEHTDTKYHLENEMSFFVPYFFPFFSKDEWDVYHDEMGTVIKLILQKSLSPSQMTPSEIKHNLGSQKAKSDNEHQFDRDKLDASPMPGGEGHQINYRYLHKIMILCEEHDIKLIGLYFPVYRPELFYDQDYYYKALRDSFPSLEVYDYSHLELPDTCRFDAHHLNWNGAQVFTRRLMSDFNFK